MEFPRPHPDDRVRGNAPTADFPVDELTGDATAWELIDHGRYMPRRIRGSCHGRELG